MKFILAIVALAVTDTQAIRVKESPVNIEYAKVTTVEGADWPDWDNVWNKV